MPVREMTLQRPRLDKDVVSYTECRQTLADCMQRTRRTHRPLVITPDFSGIETEGLSDEAKAYAEFLRQHESDLRILRYGFRLKADNYTEYVVTDRLSAVTERVRAEVAQAGDELAAVIQGVDEPWDVALVELWMREVRRSADGNIRELQEQGKLF